MEKFWICWVENSVNTTANFVHYDTFEKAQKESERLVRQSQNDGRKVFVFECCGASLIKSVTWEATKSNDVPF
jgi:hypothetical protein